MKPTLALTAAVSLALAAMLLSACGAASLQDSETATEAQAAAVTTAAETATIAAPDADSTATAESVPAADNAGAWASIKDGAQTFAAQLDQANQSIASCQTDAAAGADFDQCVGAAYTAIAAAATQLGTVIDADIGRTADACLASLTSLRAAAQAMGDDYTLAAGTTDLTSRQTLESRLADDGQTYADAALAAAAACVS